MNKKVLVVLLLVPLVASITVNSARAALRPQESEVRVRDFRSDHPTTMLAATDVLSYWTEERREAALPPPLEQTAYTGPVMQTLAQADGPAMAVAGINKGGTETGASGINIPGAGSGSPMPAFNYPFAYNYSYVQMAYVNSLIPYSTFGKLYYTNLGTDYTCSGTSVTSGGGNKSLILTAAHCLHGGDNDPASWSYNILFVPAKLAASEPFGSWTDQPNGNVWVTNNWYTTADFRDDFGFIVTDPTSNVCGELAPCIGAQGLAWNQSPVYDFWVYGYPVQSPFTGDRLVTCSASLSVLDGSLPGTGASPMGIGCNMTGGSSGGSWIIFGKTANVGYANSVVSYKYTQPSQPNAVYGPYFASNFSTLWESARLDTP